MNITNLTQLKQILNQYYYNSNVVLKTLLYKFIRYKLNTDFIKDQIYEYISDPNNDISLACFLQKTHVELFDKDDIPVSTKLIQFYTSKKYTLTLSTQDFLDYGISSFDMLFTQICERYKLSILKDITSYEEINNQSLIYVDNQFIYPKHNFIWTNNNIYIDDMQISKDYSILIQSHIIGKFDDDICIITKYNIELTSYICNQLKQKLNVNKIFLIKDNIHLLKKISG